MVYREENNLLKFNHGPFQGKGKNICATFGLMKYKTYTTVLNQ